MKSIANHQSRPSHPHHGRRLTLALVLCLTALLGLTAAPAQAVKTHLFLDDFGSAAEPGFGRPMNVAIDRSSGDLLVIDEQARTVSRFHSDGTPSDFSALGTNVIDAKGLGDGTPQNGFTFSSFSDEQQVAVDKLRHDQRWQHLRHPGSPDSRQPDRRLRRQRRISRPVDWGGADQIRQLSGFPLSPCGVAVDGAGNLFVGAGFENKIYKFDPSAKVPLAGDLVATYASSDPICNLAAGAGPSAGSVFFEFLGDLAIGKISGTSMAQQLSIPGQWKDMGINPADGHLFAAGANGFITEFDAVGVSAAAVSVFATGDLTGVAVNNAGDRIYASGGSGSSFDARLGVYGPLVTVPAVGAGQATITGDTSVTLKGSVDPDGVPLEECRFKYGLTTELDQSVPCAESVGEIGTSEKDVHADLSGLQPESTYVFELVVKNVNATVPSGRQTFKTPAKPVIAGIWSQEVGYTEAALKARINPENSPTTYRFEWGSDSSYGNATAEIAIGSDNSDHLVALPLSGLQPGATYHYRVVATNGIGNAEAADHSFTTYPALGEPKGDCPNAGLPHRRLGPPAGVPGLRDGQPGRQKRRRHQGPRLRPQLPGAPGTECCRRRAATPTPRGPPSPTR